MKRWWFLVYGVAAHLAFLLLFAYLACFVGNFLVPKTIDAPATSPVATSAAVNLLLMGVFVVQHSVMARPAFKRLWTRIVPQPIERSTYVWMANAVTVLLIWQWRPIDSIVWDVEQPFLRGALWALFAAGWLAVPAVSLMISHFDLFGTRQVWLHWQGREYQPLRFRTPLAYARVRHPLYLGWALAFWATPTMTVGHLLFAGSMSVYMVAAAVVEERDLIAHFGDAYRQYRRRVPMFVPRLRTVAAAVESAGDPVAKTVRASIDEA